MSLVRTAVFLSSALVVACVVLNAGKPRAGASPPPSLEDAVLVDMAKKAHSLKEKLTTLDQCKQSKNLDALTLALMASDDRHAVDVGMMLLANVQDDATFVQCLQNEIRQSASARIRPLLLTLALRNGMRLAKGKPALMPDTFKTMRTSKNASVVCAYLLSQGDMESCRALALSPDEVVRAVCARMLGKVVQTAPKPEDQRLLGMLLVDLSPLVRSNAIEATYPTTRDFLPMLQAISPDDREWLPLDFYYLHQSEWFKSNAMASTDETAAADVWSLHLNLLLLLASPHVDLCMKRKDVLVAIGERYRIGSMALDNLANFDMELARAVRATLIQAGESKVSGQTKSLQGK